MSDVYTRKPRLQFIYGQLGARHCAVITFQCFRPRLRIQRNYTRCKRRGDRTMNFHECHSTLRSSALKKKFKGGILTTEHGHENRSSFCSNIIGTFERIGTFHVSAIDSISRIRKPLYDRRDRDLLVSFRIRRWSLPGTRSLRPRARECVDAVVECTFRTGNDV